MRQGDTISSFMFIILIEILSFKLRQNQSILRINPNYAKLHAQYVNDIWALTKYCAVSVTALLEEFKDFCLFTGLPINYDKTRIMKIGPIRFQHDILQTEEQLVLSDTLTILGVLFSPDRLLMRDRNYDRLLDKVKKRRNMLGIKIINCNWKNTTSQYTTHIAVYLQVNVNILSIA